MVIPDWPLPKALPARSIQKDHIGKLLTSAGAQATTQHRTSERLPGSLSPTRRTTRNPAQRQLPSPDRAQHSRRSPVTQTGE